MLNDPDLTFVGSNRDSFHELTFLELGSIRPGIERPDSAFTVTRIQRLILRNFDRQTTGLSELANRNRMPQGYIGEKAEKTPWTHAALKAMVSPLIFMFAGPFHSLRMFLRHGVFLVCAFSIPGQPLAAATIDFVRDVQPILSANCYECHGPKKQEAEFRLDVKEIALEGGALGPAILPGKSAESLLIKLVSDPDPSRRMPRKGDPLTQGQIQVLQKWIDEGATWPAEASVKLADKGDHWAFKAPVRPPVPQVKNRDWARTPIDHFILARLEAAGLHPNGEAAPTTLLRRLALDLTGLPPSPKDVAAFIGDTSTNAYEQAVERLLASRHYGEQWGKHWLDVARYADSNGYEKDRARSIWPYRDWVIAAFNRDQPFDQFTIDQLAGDLLPNPTLDQRVATGFLRNSMMNQEGGIEPEQFRIEAMIDRMDAVGKAWLGLTVACAQCHNHKFDPISQKEYFQIFAFLNNDDEPFIEVPTPDQRRERAAIRKKARQLEDDAFNSSPDVLPRLADWEKSIADTVGQWEVLNPLEVLSNPIKYEKQADGSLLGGGDVYAEVTAKVWVETQQQT